MGLDIAAWSHIVYAGAPGRDYTEQDDDLHTPIFVYADVLAGQPAGRGAGLRPGPYVQQPGGKHTEFRAGSYSTYNYWRDDLAQLTEEDDQGRNVEPFHDLVHFSDCEGYLGAATCAKLAASFERLRPRAEARYTPHFLCMYDKFAHALRIAAQDGVLVFC